MSCVPWLFFGFSQSQSEAQKHVNEKAVKEHRKSLSMAVKLSVIRCENTRSIIANVRLFKQINCTVYIEK